MASEDPRALLAAARKERRVVHPHASYTSTGNLLCNLCELPIKSHAAWGAHLHSTGHTLRLSREQDAATARKESSNGTKRKASSPIDDGDLEDRKRAKRPGNEDASAQNAIPSRQAASEPQPAPAPAPTPTEPTTDEQAEFDALEADLAELERESKASAALDANTISAPAQTAEDIAAQAREEQSAQRGRRDAEIEDEKEEAARALEEEFAEMRTLEDRVKKLRAKRESLRVGTVEQAAGSVQSGGDEIDASGVNGTEIEGEIENGKAAEDEDEDDEDDDDEDFDDWTFGAR